MNVAVAVGGLNERSGEQAEDADQGHRRKAAPGLLVLALAPACLVGKGVGHRDAGAVDHPDVPPVPEILLGDAALQAINEVAIDLIHFLEGNARPSLAVSARARTHGTFCVRELAPDQSHDLTHGLTTGSIGSLHLVEKAPEHDFKRKNALSAVVALGGW